MLIYKKQEILIEGAKLKTTAKYKRRVRQDCYLSPCLFNLFIEETIEKYKKNAKRIIMNEEKIHCI